MTKNNAIIERFRYELGLLRHIGGQLVQRLRDDTLTDVDRRTIVEASKTCQELRELLAKLRGN